jgi:tetratricopeptide (TPR) repeat protein
MRSILRSGVAAATAMGVVSWSVPAPPAAAQPAHPAATAGINVQAEVAAAVYAATATHQAIERGLDTELKAKRQRIVQLEARVKAGEAAAQAELAEARKQFTDELAARDRVYAAEIAAFRGAVEDIAKTSEGARALALFNSGHERDAIDILDRLVAAEAKGLLDRANVEIAAKKRQVAELDLEARDRGKVSTAEVVTRYEEVTRLDPGLQWDWVTLCRLYRDAGRLAEARQAAEHAARTAADDRDRAAALTELGGVLAAQGDLDGALKAYRDGLTIARALAAADPSSADARRNVSVTLDKMGDVLMAQGALAAALKAYQEDLEIARALAEADPSDPETRRDVIPSLDRLGDVLMAQGDLAGALKAYQEGLAIARALAEADPSSARAKRDVSVSLDNVGDVLRAQGDLAGALEAYQEDLEIARALAEADPSNAEARRDVMPSLDRVGDLRMAQGDLVGALKAYQEGLTIARALAAADPSSARAKRDVAVSLGKLGDGLKAKGDLGAALEAYQEELAIARALAAAEHSSAEARRDVAASLWKLASIRGSGVTWAQVVEALETIDKAGQLAPADRPALEQARRNAAAQEAPK